MAARLWPIKVFYDGGCPICRRQAGHWERRDRRRKLRFIDISDPSFSARRHGLDPDRVRQSIHVKTADGRLFRGIDAVRMIWTAFPPMWGAAALSGLPGIHRLLGAGYRAIARNRHRLGGACPDDVCSAARQDPDPSESTGGTR